MARPGLAQGLPGIVQVLFRRPEIARPVGDLGDEGGEESDRKSTRLNSSHLVISYAVFCLKKKTAGLLVATKTLTIIICCVSLFVNTAPWRLFPFLVSRLLRLNTSTTLTLTMP